jgi:hypothetical protein
VSTKVTESVAGTFDDQSTMDYLRRFMPEPEPSKRPERDPDAEYGGVLRKRPGR